MTDTYLLRNIPTDVYNTARQRADDEAMSTRFLMLEILRIYVNHGLPNSPIDVGWHKEFGTLTDARHDYLLRNIPIDLHRAVKVRATDECMTIRYILLQSLKLYALHGLPERNEFGTPHRFDLTKGNN